MPSIHLRDFLIPIEFGENERPAVMVDPATRFGFVSDRVEGAFRAVRVDANYSKAIVPVFDWGHLRVDEDAEILKVLLAAGAASPLGLGSPKAVDATYWVKNRTHREVVLLNPQTRVFLPVGLKAYRSEGIPPNQMLLLGRPQHVGYYVKQGHRRGVLAHDKKGLLLITFLSS